MENLFLMQSTTSLVATQNIPGSALANMAKIPTFAVL
jgi:hypothetical protein